MVSTGFADDDLPLLLGLTDVSLAAAAGCAAAAAGCADGGLLAAFAAGCADGGLLAAFAAPLLLDLDFAVDASAAGVAAAGCADDDDVDDDDDNDDGGIENINPVVVGRVLLPKINFN